MKEGNFESFKELVTFERISKKLDIWSIEDIEGWEVTGLLISQMALKLLLDLISINKDSKILSTKIE
jgi:hypothetical protein